MSKARDLASAAPAPSTVSATELGYVDGVTSAIQTQIDGKQAVVSGVTDTEIGYLDGVTSAIQTQINAQIPKSIVDAKGDIIAATAADTVSKLTVGANDTVLTADSSTATGLKWAAPAGGAGNMALITSGTTNSGSSFTVSGLSSYTEILILMYSQRITNASRVLSLRLNGNSGSNYNQNGNILDTNGPSINNYVTVNEPAFYLTNTNMDAEQAQTAWAIKLTNCKNPGFTDMDFTANYQGTKGFNCKGVYAVNEAISSFTVSVGSPATFNNGSYIVYGA